MNPPLAFLNNQTIEDIHAGTLRILSEVGIRLTHPQALDVLVGAGGTVDHDRVLLPPDLVEKAIGKCPTRVRLLSRGGVEIILGEGDLHWHNLGGARDVHEPAKGKNRPASVQDVIDAARILDALSNCTTITPFFTPQDVPGSLMSLAMYRHTIPHTTKSVHGPGVQTADEVQYLCRMAEVLGTPSEILSIGISPISPLTFPDNLTAAILATSQAGIPFGPLPCPTAGLTAPLSIAGALTQQNAEVLASIVIAQLVNPGLPVFYCGRLALLEPRTGGSVWGGVELGMVSAATVQIGHRYGLPVNVYGFSTNAHDIGIQNGYERALNAVIPAMAGADELSGIGEISAGVCGSFAQMVIDDEIAAGVRRLQRGFSVDEDSLAINLIGEVMGNNTNFISDSHTVRYLRQGELLLTKLAERHSESEWEKMDREGLVERAQAKVNKILSEHEIEPLSEIQNSELDNILHAAEKQLG
jgi:trimethylamine--corrinoid protein Co-methyltransferase